MEEGAPDMPLDLIFGILLWLPVASLLRFKSVSKSWLSLIQSSDFVYLHIPIVSDSKFDSNNFNIELLFLTMPRELHHPQQLSLIQFKGEEDESGEEEEEEEEDNNEEVEDLVPEPELHLPVINDPFQVTHVELVASCNGIICLRQHRSVCLWNPATQRSITLPPLPVQPTHFYCNIGFGFDVKTNDYKVVCINGGTKHTVHICSLRSDSWKMIDSASLELINFRFSSVLSIPYRNTNCWLVGGSVGDRVLTFDFCSEVFGTIPLPFVNKFQMPIRIFILREKIACIIRLDSEEPKVSGEGFEFGIWTLNDYGVNECWTKLYSIQFCSMVFDWTTWFSKNGDSLLMFLDGGLWSYDLETQKMKYVSGHMSSSRVVMYAESLVSVERGDRAAKSMNPKDGNEELLISKSMPRDNNCWCDIDIPEVLVFRILLWLPVTSLLRLKSVCKSWCTLIKSTNFVDQHLLQRQHPYGNDNINLIIHTFETLHDHSSVFEDSSSPCWNTSCACLLSDNKFELLDFPCLPGYWLTITTSFNGIICLKDSHELGVYLWNPATKQIRNITVDSDLMCCCDGCIDTKSFNFGFGLDTKTNDYKLVRFHSGFGGVRPNVFDVYNLSTDSWRTIADKCLPTFDEISSSLTSPYRSRFYCWLVRDNTTESHSILSFDFSNEEFSAIPLPEGIDQSLFTFDLAIFKENIACICRGDSCEIWMMSEYGIKESWTKLYTDISLPSARFLELAYSKKNRDVLLFRIDDRWFKYDFIVMYEYDLVTRETKELRFSVRGPNHYQVVLYEESLIPIKRGFY